MFSLIKFILKRRFKEKTLIITLLSPIILLAIVINVLNIKEKSIQNDWLNQSISVGVYIEDKSEISEHIVLLLENQPEYLVKIYLDYDKLEEEALLNNIDASVVVLANADQKFLNNEPFIKSFNQTLSPLIESNINQKMNVLNMLLNSTNDLDKAINLHQQTIINEVKITDSVNYSSLITFINMATYLMLASIISHSKSFTEDIILKMNQRIMTTPINNSSYIIANVLSWLSLGLIQIILMNSLFYFSNISINLFWLTIILLLSSFVGSMIGILIALLLKGSVLSLAKSISMVILAMLGGLFWPIYITPEIMQNIGKLTPFYWTGHLINKVLMNVSINQMIIDLMVLFGYGIMLMLIASYIMNYKKQSK